MVPRECPRCGCTNAVTRGRASGPVQVFYDLEARTVDYSAMYESLTYRGGVVLYCKGCGRRLGGVEDVGDFESDGTGWLR